MGLVEYSESEGSDVEERPEVKTQKSAAKTSKVAFQKVVDRSNPHKIQVNLPQLGREPLEEKQEDDEPPAKKARTGGGPFTGFNSFLPAPKRSVAGSGGLNGVGSKRGGLGSGVSLKTGAAPGFSREPVIDYGLAAEDGKENGDGNDSFHAIGDLPEHGNTQKSALLNLPLPKTTSNAQEEPKNKGNSMMFKPLSVARKPQKKKSHPSNGEVDLKTKDSAISTKPKPPPKVSLFSVDPLPDHHENESTNNGTYEPLIYGAQEQETSSTERPQAENPYISDAHPPAENIPQSMNPPGPQSLSTIASDLNLSASAKRQLFGRQKPNASAVNIVNFNTDQEYAANELLRQAGEQVQHNPVRAIAPGKHSLKQLVNAASNQKDALEEQFASGRRSKKEAGSRPPAGNRSRAHAPRVSLPGSATAYRRALGSWSAELVSLYPAVFDDDDASSDKPDPRSSCDIMRIIIISHQFCLPTIFPIVHHFLPPILFAILTPPLISSPHARMMRTASPVVFPSEDPDRFPVADAG
ncbi:MAG: hypothetical protein Q9216_006980 [Gyalolechia sp. 2 TL-2023]